MGIFDNIAQSFGIPQSEAIRLRPKFRPSKANRVRVGAIILGAIFVPLLIGACFGYSYGYNRLMRDKQQNPTLWPLSRGMWFSIIYGIIMSLLVLVAVIILGTIIFSMASSGNFLGALLTGQLSMMWFQLPFAILVLFLFGLWRARLQSYLSEVQRYGSARYATDTELEPYLTPKNPANSLYIGGGGYFYEKNGHVLTVAGTRAGKGTNIILPNLLGAGGFNGSWVVVDPKGENAAISARYQREQGKDVRILNPWGLLDLETSTYNPLDLIGDPNSEDLPDDAQLIAQMIVPTKPGGKGDDHWNNSARSLIAAILMHMSTTMDKEELTLGNLWHLLRLNNDEWLNLLTDMSENEHPVSGPIIEGAGDSMLGLMANSDKEAAGIISSAQRWTDIFKSIPLRRSLESSSFSIGDLSQGNTALYIIIPADKLKTHYAWLRLVVTTAMKSVIRNPKERVCFLLDECYALGYLQELEVALGTYAGYGVTVHAIFQSLVQIKELYGANWENFIGNSAVFHAFGLNDQTTAKYVSDMAGQTSIPSYSVGPTGPQLSGASPRQLLTPDEARRLDDEMVVFIEQNPPARLLKLPYYEQQVWAERADPNPYYKP